MTQCDGLVAVSALVKSFCSVRHCIQLGSSPCTGRYPIHRHRCYTSRPKPQHTLEVEDDGDEPVYDVYSTQLTEAPIRWLWSHLEPLLDSKSKDAVERYRVVSGFFADFLNLRVGVRCTRLKPSGDGFRSELSTFRTRLGQVLRCQDSSDLHKCLQQTLLMACSLLHSKLITFKEFMKLLTCAAGRRGESPNPLRLEEEELCEVLRRVPGPHRPAVRKHLLANKDFSSSDGQLSPRLVAAVFDLF